MATEKTILVFIPARKSRHYAIYKGGLEKGFISFTQHQDNISVWFASPKEKVYLDYNISELNQSLNVALQVFADHKIIADTQQISRVGMKIIAPSTNFLEPRIINDEALNELSNIFERAQLNDNPLLGEIRNLWNKFPGIPLVGISDSAFHSHKPDRAWNYGIDINLSDRLGLKRFGHDGLICESVVGQLINDLPSRLVICHLGAETVSVNAVFKGQSIDSTSSYSALDGPFSATTAGGVDYRIIVQMKNEMSLTEEQMVDHLTTYSGLKGLSGQSSSLAELIELRTSNNPLAKLAIDTFVYDMQKSIGQMVAALGGADCLVFTGTAATKLPSIRSEIVNSLGFLGFAIDSIKNAKCQEPIEPTKINLRTRVNQILVAPAYEESIVAKKVINFSC